MDTGSLSGFEKLLSEARFARFTNRFRCHDRRRKYIHAKLDGIRVLRNRIAHHEPIYRSPLPAIYHDILEIAAMIHADAHEFIVSYSRAADVISGM